jgi:gamma-glutamyltranspeptidase/glutathione hydrolase
VPDVDWLHRYIEATRLAYADRALYVADPAYTAAPGGDWATLLSPAYLAQRAALIGPKRAPLVEAGRPAGVAPVALGPMAEQPSHGTSHVSVVDAQGRAVALTGSVESAFGARVMSDGGSGLPGGFLLNNHMTDFALAPTDAQGRLVANRIQPGKRPRSSMSPTLVFDAKSGQLLMTVGSPGGSFIIHFTGRTLLGTLAWGLDAQRAIDLPHFGSTGGPVWLEKGRFPVATVQALRAGEIIRRLRRFLQKGETGPIRRGGMILMERDMRLTLQSRAAEKRAADTQVGSAFQRAGMQVPTEIADFSHDGAKKVSGFRAEREGFATQSEESYSYQIDE